MALLRATCTATEGLTSNDGRGKASQTTHVRKKWMGGTRGRTLGTMAPTVHHPCWDKVGLETFLYEVISGERFVCVARDPACLLSASWVHTSAEVMNCSETFS